MRVHRRGPKLPACVTIFFAESSYDCRVKFVFKDLNPSVQALGGIVRQDCYLSLREDLPVIDLLIDVMHCAPGYLFARHERLLPRFEARELRQK